MHPLQNPHYNPQKLVKQLRNSILRPKGTTASQSLEQVGLPTAQEPVVWVPGLPKHSTKPFCLQLARGHCSCDDHLPTLPIELPLVQARVCGIFGKGFRVRVQTQVQGFRV